jgi:hypothetical protein
MIPNAEAAFIACGLPENRDEGTDLTSIGGAVKMGQAGFEYFTGGGTVSCVSEFE